MKVRREPWMGGACPILYYVILRSVSDVRISCVLVYRVVIDKTTIKTLASAGVFCYATLTCLKVKKYYKNFPKTLDKGDFYKYNNSNHYRFVLET